MANILAFDMNKDAAIKRHIEAPNEPRHFDLDRRDRCLTEFLRVLVLPETNWPDGYFVPAA